MTPDWYTPSKSRHEMNQNVDAGLHPIGEELLVDIEVASCRNCINRVDGAAGRASRSYWKCRVFGVTNDETTDIRLKWPACVEWFPKDHKRQCAGCGAVGLVVAAGGRALACSSCGAMFDFVAWIRPRPDLCSARRTDGDPCVLQNGHHGPHQTRDGL